MHYWLHCDGQAQYGDLRRIQILVSDELSLREDLRGPFDKKEDVLKIAESLMWSIVPQVLERLCNEEPKKFATFPSAGETAEE